MTVYVTFFDVGSRSETLIIDSFERTEELINWDSQEDYFRSRRAEPKPIDGERIQDTLAQFVAREVDHLRPRCIVLGHHDDWNPPMIGPTDLEVIEGELALEARTVELVHMGYLDGFPILGQ